MKINGRTVRRAWVYFRRGQTTYFGFLINLLNFLVIQYNLLIKHVYFLKLVFPTFITFLLIFPPAYFLLVTMVGYLDRKKGTLKEEVSILAEANPVLNEILRKLNNIEEKISGENKCQNHISKEEESNTKQ